MLNRVNQTLCHIICKAMVNLLSLFLRRGIMMRGSSDEGISQDGEELTMAEIKVQLEVSEGETGLLRKKVENLLTDNLKLTKEIKEANKAKAKPGYSSSRSGGDPDARLHDVQDELNSTRSELFPYVAQ